MLTTEFPAPGDDTPTAGPAAGPTVRRALVVLLALWALFIVYGTTLPFDFSAGAATARLGWQTAHRIPWRAPDGGWPSIPDVVSNILLFMPWGALAAMTLLSRGRPWITALVVGTLSGLALSLGVEMLQLFSPPRTSSATDLLTNSTGSFAGAVGGILWWRGAWPWAKPRLVKALQRRPYATLAVAVAVALLIAGLAPFDVSIDVDDLKTAIKGTTLIPFGSPIRGVQPAAQPLDWIGQVLLWSLAGGVFAMGLAEGRARMASSPLILRASMATGALGLLSEFAQLFIVSRGTNSTTVFLAVVGGALGAALFASRFRAHPRHAILSGMSIWGAVLILARWAPFEFTSPNFAATHWTRWLPFLAYFQRTNMSALSDLYLEVGGGLPLGILLAARPGGSAPLKSGMIGLVVGLVLEFGQGFVVGRHSDITDAFSLGVGAALGAWLWAWGLRRWRAGTA